MFHRWAPRVTAGQLARMLSTVSGQPEGSRSSFLSAWVPSRAAAFFEWVTENHGQESKANERRLKELEFCRSRGLMTPLEAQQTAPVHVKEFLSHNEIERILSQFQIIQEQGAVGMHERDMGFGAQLVPACWRTSYLHTDGIFEQHFLELREKLRQTIFEVDAANWKVLQGRQASGLHFRTVEFHEYIAPAELNGESHFDAGSLITIDVMLAEPGVDYTGGDLVMPEADGTLRAPELQKGDAVLFLSHKYHNVQPILTGKRSVLVAEIWDGPERSCAHRCTSVEPCSYKGRARAQ